MIDIVVEPLDFQRPLPPKSPKIVLLGLTPGHQQASALSDISSRSNASFKGSMRGDIYRWFTELGISEIFGLADEDHLFMGPQFEDTRYITSLLRDPVYVVKSGIRRNYSGRSPLPWKHLELFKMMEETFDILRSIESKPILIPMGKVVSEALIRFARIDDKFVILHGFPHPSGLNGHRHRIFRENFDELKTKVNDFSRSL